MSEKQPSFEQRIRLLECAAETVKDQAATDGNQLLSQMADVIFTEVEAMKIVNKRFRTKRAKRSKARNAKAASPETALTS